MLAHYVSRQSWHVPLVCDPDRSAYTAFGLERTSTLSFFYPHVVLRYLWGMMRGYMLKMPYAGEDVLQLGGDFILDRELNVIFAYRSANPTDRPSVTKLLAPLKNATTKG
jgi:hypothetical protein